MFTGKMNNTKIFREEIKLNSAHKFARSTYHSKEKHMKSQILSTFCN